MIENYRTNSKPKRQKHRALGSIKSANPSQSNPDDSASDSDSDSDFDSQSLSIPPRTNRRSVREKGEREKKKKEMKKENVLVFGGMAGKE